MTKRVLSAAELSLREAWEKEVINSRVGKKYDGGKDRLDLVPPEAILLLAKVLTLGAKKYGDRNWERGLHWGRVYAALQRHLFAWWGGEATDVESGLSHLGHALCCLVFLATYEVREMDVWDDRKNFGEGQSKPPSDYP